MDMTRFLKPFLTVMVLQDLGGDYEGIISAVANEHLRNRFKATSDEQAVISFLDGKRLVLNKTMLQACIRWFGEDSADWIGRRIRVFLKPGKRGLERGLVCEDAHARQPGSNCARESVERSAGPDGPMTAGNQDGVLTADGIAWNDEEAEEKPA